MLHSLYTVRWVWWDSRIGSCCSCRWWPRGTVSVRRGQFCTQFTLADRELYTQCTLADRELYTQCTFVQREVYPCTERTFKTMYPSTERTLYTMYPSTQEFFYIMYCVGVKTTRIRQRGGLNPIRYVTDCLCCRLIPNCYWINTWAVKLWPAALTTRTPEMSETAASA